MKELKERRGEEYKWNDDFEKTLDKILPVELNIEKVSKLPITYSQVDLDDEGKRSVDVYQILLDIDDWQPLNFAKTFPDMDKSNRPTYISFEDTGDALSLAKKSLLSFMNTTISQTRPEDVYSAFWLPSLRTWESWAEGFAAAGSCHKAN